MEGNLSRKAKTRQGLFFYPTSPPTLNKLIRYTKKKALIIELSLRKNSLSLLHTFSTLSFSSRWALHFYTMPFSQPGRTNRRFLLSRFLSSLHSKTPYLRALPYASLEIIILVALVNILIWIVAAVVLRFYPHLSASSILAYSLGLRHALDADHISAIDLTTRRLLAVGRRDSNQHESGEDGVQMTRPKPVVTVGMWFSLGHST